MSKNKEYVKNTAILFMGKFATQFISFLLIPLYTRHLIASDYGMVDLIQTYISLFVPILIFRLDSAVFRFLIDERSNEQGKKKIITNTFFIIFISIILFTILLIIVGQFIQFKYLYLALFNILVLMISNILLQISRGVGNNKQYSISCVITAIITLLSNVIFVVYFNLDAGCILLSSIIANFVCSVYLFLKNKIYLYIKYEYISKLKIKELLKYSFPMIPNSLSWWIVDVSDRTIISGFLGTALNGIYTISCKFSNIINSVFSIFNMSWQEWTSIHINDDDRDSSFSEMMLNLLNIFVCLSLVGLSFISLFYDIVVGDSYLSSYNYIPILVIANIFHILIQLFGGIYVAKKMTKKLMNTTLLSAFLNFVINICFIKRFGLYAASFSTFISYVILTIYRYYDVKKIINIKIKPNNLILYSFSILLVSLLYYINNFYLNILNLCFAIFISIFINKEIILSFLCNIKNKIKN